MIDLHCWNDFDPLKTVILGSVFDNDKIPERYTGEDQENFIKLNEESNIELNNYQKILEQNGVKVLRPKQPKNYNGFNLPFHDPTINMRDFFITYGNIFFTSYGPYEERRYQHFWIENIYNEILQGNNLIVNSPEINLDGGSIDPQSLLNDSEYFDLIGYEKKPKNLTHAKIMMHHETKYNHLEEWDYFKKHNILYKNKICFHTAAVLKRNDKAYIASYGNLSKGHLWFEKWLKFLNVEPIYIPKICHIDGSVIFLNNKTLLIRPESWRHNKKPILDYFDNISTVFYIPIPEIVKNLPLTYQVERFHPTKWLKKWKKYFINNEASINCLVINSKTVLFCFYDKEFYAKLKKIGIEAIYVKWSNAKFWEGNLHCITCELERRPE